MTPKEFGEWIATPARAMVAVVFIGCGSWLVSRGDVHVSQDQVQMLITAFCAFVAGWLGLRRPGDPPSGGAT